jgi:hypothetical protein
MRIERPFFGPSIVQSPTKFQVGNPCSPRPTRHRVGNAVMHNYAHPGAIPTLLRGECPHAVSRLVIAIAIFPLKRMTRRRPWSHVGKERLEGNGPSFTNRDAAPTVTVPRRRVRIAAPALRSAPRPILGRPFETVLLKRDRGSFDFPASAGLRMPASKALTTHNCLLSARTNTEPAGLTVLGICRTRQDAQSPEGRTKEVFMFHQIACHEAKTMQRKHKKVKVLSVFLEAKDAAVRAKLFT